jgi:restriction system protein
MNNNEDQTIIPPHGGYRKLLSYQMATIVYDATVVFCARFIDKRSRTHDQMVQAARSGKQNIAEGSMASGTSKKIELKLIGIARASLEELLQDYEDYLRQNRFSLWGKDDAKTMEIRNLGRLPDKSYESYRKYIEDGSPEAAANTLVCVINQTNFLLDRQLRRLEQDYMKDGGITEKMYNFRKKRK